MGVKDYFKKDIERTPRKRNAIIDFYKLVMMALLRLNMTFANGKTPIGSEVIVPCWDVCDFVLRCALAFVNEFKQVC